MELSNLIYTLVQIFTITTLTQSAQIPYNSHTSSSSPSPPMKEPTVQIQCLSGSMLITIKDAPSSPDSGLFNGMVYPKGLSKNSTCLKEYRHHSGSLRYKLPLRSCNTMPQELDDNGIQFTNAIVLQPHFKLVTDLGRSYHVLCRYKSREASAALTIGDENSVGVDAVKSVDRRDHGRSLGSQHSSDNEIPMPACHMRIYSHDKVAEQVKIGDPLKLKIYIDKQDKYGLHVLNCTVRDGLGWSEQNLLRFGCPLDGEIMGEFDYSDDRSMATVEFPAHKFPYTASVYYECNIRLCTLNEEKCKKAPDCSEHFGLRSRREVKEGEDDDDARPATIEVFSGLYVNENAEIIEGADDSVFAEKKPDDALCVSQRSFAIGIAIAGLILMLLVVIAVLCIMARRHRKSVSNSGSSIYSGPYTNTAFSHSS